VIQTRGYPGDGFNNIPAAASSYINMDTAWIEKVAITLTL